ncbi:MAG: NAD(P)H-binding protein [Opitutales bacterium]
MLEENNEALPLVGVAGASGFVGTHLRTALSEHFRFRALTRSQNVINQARSLGHTEWTHCDLYSLPQLTEALKGCKIGIYLVHSMAPSSRLVQANFADTDILLADNFVRAAEEAGLEHIIYLGGLMPESGEDVSPHLASRAEVEQVLRSRSIPVTVLRAGLVFGPGGSSFSMLINLVGRLPLMVLPAWTGSMTHSIDIVDVCRAFEYSMLNPDLRGGTYDIAGHEAMSYRELILKTAELTGRRIRSISVPVNCFSLSRRWVSWFGGVSCDLVGPLLESLRHDLTAQKNPVMDHISGSALSFEESLERAVDTLGKPKPNPRSATRKVDNRDLIRASLVRSVQRMSLPAGIDAQEMAQEYGVWLTRVFRGSVRVTRDEKGILRFSLFRRKWVLLELTPTPFSANHPIRCAFYITGGLLAREVSPKGRFEFRIFPSVGISIASIHGFAPSLPWYLYSSTQAIAHLWVMRAFGRYLSRWEQR